MVRCVNKILFMLAACIAIVACRASEGVITADVDYLGWAAGDVARVEYVNKDTTSLRSIYILVRRRSALNYDDIRFTIETTSPTKKYLSETISIPHDYESDSHQGYTEIEVPYRLRSVLQEEGVYKFYIWHSGESLVGIQGVGIVIR